ncbi:MAG: hypothetical protein L6R38_003995 [Xanthoria sp. 2 TBL-2021]|nr:MAG: hypothetical protein L6R38_003995 [Xanthoria sp. 2 TBL-2021]
MTSGTSLPNPYPIPETPYNATFRLPKAPLIREDVLGCLNYARREVVSHIKEYGDGPIPNGQADPLLYPYRTVFFDIDSNELPENQRLSYNVAAAVLVAFELKMTEEGYFHREAEIVMADSGEVIGEARLGQGGKPWSTRLQLGPLPNPFPLPDTLFSLDFHEDHTAARQLPPANVAECIATIRRETLQHIRRYGNGPIPPLGFQISGIGVDLVSAHQQTPLTYQDFVAILLVFSHKMGREGYYERFADIIMSEGGEIIGDVQMYSEPIGRPRPKLMSKASI